MLPLELGRDADDVAVAAALHLAARARAGVSMNGTFCVALSGGRTPWRMLESLLGQGVPWADVHVFQIDEREADSGDAHRNATRLAAILNRSALPPAQLHLMPVVGMNQRACDAYARLIARHGHDGRLDLVHLGLGEDGHTASLVPGDRVLEVADRDVAMTGSYRGLRRMTLTYPALDRAAERMWVVTGGSKATMLARLCTSDVAIPAGRVTPRRSIVFADTAATACLQDPNLRPASIVK